jgi:hypothetical protein
LTIDEALVLAPQEAVSAFSVGDGTIRFYAQGTHRFDQHLIAMRVDHISAYSDKEFIATKVEGRWVMKKLKQAEAAFKLESLGWKWDEQAEDWKLEREVVTGEDAQGRVFPIGEEVK